VWRACQGLGLLEAWLDHDSLAHLPPAFRLTHRGMSRRTSAMVDSWQLDDFSTEAYVGRPSSPSSLSVHTH